jgi:hypothetical protein
MKRLGDPHNFGRFVHRAGANLLFKPRTCAWEDAYLSANGAIRRLIQPHFQEKCMANPFDTAPILAFRPRAGDSLFSGCYVEELEARSAIDPDFFEIQEHTLVGSVIALLTWLGITDLHAQNMAFGKVMGRFICAPLDVECIFSDLRLPSQTLLLPSNLISEERCGLSSYLKIFWKNPSSTTTAAVVEGFCAAIETLEGHAQSIYAGLQEISDFAEIPIRVIVRSTSAYIAYLESGSIPSPCFSPVESEQLARGDIPYFVRFPASEAIHYAASDTKWERAPEPLGSGGGQQFLLFQGSEGAQRRHSKALLEEGALQLARLLDPGCTGSGVYKGTKVTFDSTVIAIQRGGLRVFTKRRMQD